MSDTPSGAQADQPSADEREEEIRTRAYYLWEQAPEPKGSPEEYWEQARAHVEKEAPPLESGIVDDSDALIAQKPLK